MGKKQISDSHLLPLIASSESWEATLNFYVLSRSQLFITPSRSNDEQSIHRVLARCRRSSLVGEHREKPTERKTAERAFRRRASPLLFLSCAIFRTVPQLTERREEAKRAHTCNPVNYLVALRSMLPCSSTGS